jgi:AcrR family transcriptional regulator
MGTAMPKIVDPAEQRSAIRRAARRVFSRRGVAGIGLAHVAREADMGRSTIYHYYRDKTALTRDLVRELLAEEEALFSAAARGLGTPIERLERLTVALTGLFEGWASLGRMLLDLQLRDAALFRPFFRRIRRDLASLIAEGQRDGEIDRALDPAITSAAVIGAVDGLLLQYLVDRRAIADPSALGETLLRIFGKAVRP